METINLLVSLDANYLPRLPVLLTSAARSDPAARFNLYLLHGGLADAALEPLRRWSGRTGGGFFPIRVADGLFRDAPATRQYPREMYYRLLAGALLPDDVTRVLYLDPDILVINPLTPLWRLELDGRLFAAAAHTGRTELAGGVNRLRLGIDHDYYNSGVLLMDLRRMRSEVRPQELFAYAAAHGRELVLPDQDLLNALYGSRILPIPDELWNYDARNYNGYLLRSGGVCDLPWVMEHTAILHFCGRAKPWRPHYPYRFGVLYRHYMQLAAREMRACMGR